MRTCLGPCQQYGSENESVPKSVGVHRARLLPTAPTEEVALSRDSPTTTLRESSCPSRLLALPTEIICVILDHIPLTRTLRLCSLVCKTLLPLVLSRLYRNLVLRSSTRGLALPYGALTILDDRSEQVLYALTTSPYGIRRYPTKLDFDLRSNFTATQIGATLAKILEPCRNVVELELGKGDRGHGMPFSALSEMMARIEQSDKITVSAQLKALVIEECVGNGSTLANVLVRLPRLVELRVGQFLLEAPDLEESTILPAFQLESFVAKYRLTPFAFTFCTSSSSSTLRSIDVPINERTSLDLSRCTALVEVTLSLSLTSSLPKSSSATQTSYFSNKRSGTLLAESPSALAATPSLSRLAENFESTVSSVPYLSRLSIKGHWDEPEALDIVRHASLLARLPRSLETLSIKTELNSIALVEWFEGMSTRQDEIRDRGGGGGAGGGAASRYEGRVKKLKLWQKTTFASMKREFQRRVRERVQDSAQEKGIVCEWYKYEKW